MFFNEDYLANAVKASPNGSEMKIFLFIALNQPKEGICGFQISKEQLADNLNISLPTVFRSIKYLKDNLLIQELKLPDSSDFMANPYFVTNNLDNKDRINEFNRRCDIDSAKKREKRLREQKKAAKKNS